MKRSRVIIAGTSSGSGKTSAVCAVLTLLKRRKSDVGSFKCGPDYIDPMFHRTVTGVPCSNLDPFFCDTDLLGYLLAENSGGDINIIEGVMGYYDGTGADGTDNSTFTVAEKTDSPVILVVDSRGASASLTAVIEGFLNYAPDSRIVGVIFNRMSPMNYAHASGLMKRRFGDRVKPMGYIPELPAECVIPSRHLGLVTAGEIADIRRRLEKIADICEGTIDIDGIIAAADTAPELKYISPDIPRYDSVGIAVAYDEAFCFYYHDTLALLKRMGAEICFFSPLDNEPVPECADGLLLGGGYPELHAGTLEANTVSKESIYRAVKGGMPTIAECGGFQYLGAELEGRRMCGVLSHKSRDTGALVRFGYITLTADKDGLLGDKGTALKAHEFHYLDSSDCGADLRAVKPNGRAWDCGVLTDTLYAGYPHLYLYSNISAADSFYIKCLLYKEKRNDYYRP